MVVPLQRYEISTPAPLLSSLGRHLSQAPYTAVVEDWEGCSLSVKRARLLCTPPRRLEGFRNNTAVAADALELLNAVSWTPWHSDVTAVQLAANVSLVPQLWPDVGVHPNRSMTLFGTQRYPNVTVLDLQDVDPFFTLAPPHRLTLQDVMLINLPLVAGYAPVVLQGMAPLFTIPLFFLRRPQELPEPIISLMNVTLVVAAEEYRYLSVGSALVTAIVVLNDPRQDTFEEVFGTLVLGRTGRDSIFLVQFDGRSGIDIQGAWRACVACVVCVPHPPMRTWHTRSPVCPCARLRPHCCFPT